MHTAPICEEEYTLPSAEALMAGTLALITGYAQSAPGCTHRPVLARKLITNLRFLSEHPHLSAPMQTMLSNLRTRWLLELERVGPAGSSAPTGGLWHPTPEVLQ
jgi:hypothetical protein